MSFPWENIAIPASLTTMLLFIGIFVVVQIIVVKIIAWAVTNTVLDVLESRGWKR